ncbi:hypothetical protein ACQPXS_46525 [Streptomyces sp. CA-142005]|uniref:hypothetical protein n=1 Tax=Streptomyces sp. CA-142005 TaxID=3240052 RepID=UPI003D8F7A9F
MRDGFVVVLAMEAARYRPDVGAPMGPGVIAQRLATVAAAMEQARVEGVTVAEGGEVPEGLMLAPTVLCGLGQESAVGARGDLRPRWSRCCPW